MINIQINSTELKDNTELSISEVEPGIVSLYIYDPDDRHNGKYITVYVSNLKKAIDFSSSCGVTDHDKGLVSNDKQS